MDTSDLQDNINITEELLLNLRTKKCQFVQSKFCNVQSSMSWDIFLNELVEKKVIYYIDAEKVLQKVSFEAIREHLAQADSYRFQFRVSYKQYFEWYTATVSINEKAGTEIVSVKIKVVSQNILNRQEIESNQEFLKEILMNGFGNVYSNVMWIDVNHDSYRMLNTFGNVLDVEMAIQPLGSYTLDNPGYAANGVYKDDWDVFFHHTSIQYLREHLKKEGDSFSFQIRHLYNGEYRWTEVKTVCIKLDADHFHALYWVEDINDKVYDSIGMKDTIASIAVGQWRLEIKNNQEKKLTISPSLMKILEIDESDADNENLEKFLEYIYPEDREKARKTIFELTKNKEISLTVRLNDSKKGLRYFRCGIKCVVKNNIYVCYQGYAQDITEIMQPMVDQLLREEMEQQKKLEEVAEKANAANKAKSRFLSNMSHDIRTPLNGIIGLLKINETHRDDELLVKKNREKMEAAANHLLSLINDVLQMSKIEDGSETITKEAVSLKQLASEIEAIIYESTTEKDILLEYERNQELAYPYVMTSPLHLRQIFLNIYGNSIKFTKNGGKISTRQECLGTKGNVVTYRWTISDTGIGMSKEFVDHVFEPFAQETQGARSNYTGTGLGLSIVKNLIDRMGGRITVASDQGKGTTFVVEIPFEIADACQIQKEKTDAIPTDIQGVNLLLAEDNELNAEIAQMLLEDVGATITIVGNGQEAVEQFCSSPAGTYHAILMDIMMPVMDGYEAARAIRCLKRQDAKTIPIIAMTANAFAEDAQKCLEAGMNAHIAKPLDIEIVKKIICEQMNYHV